MSNDIARLRLDLVTVEESQAWVKARLAPIWDALATPSSPDPYVDCGDRTIVGENSNGAIMAPDPTRPDWWMLFDLANPAHRACAEASRSRRQIAFLDLESDA